MPSAKLGTAVDAASPLPIPHVHTTSLTYIHQNCTSLCRHLASGTYSAEDQGRPECQGIHTSTHTLHLQSISGGIWWTQTHFLCSSDKITLNYMFCNTSQSSPTVLIGNWLDYYPLLVASSFTSQFPCPYLCFFLHSNPCLKISCWGSQPETRTLGYGLLGMCMHVVNELCS